MRMALVGLSNVSSELHTYVFRKLKSLNQIYGGFGYIANMYLFFIFFLSI